MLKWYTTVGGLGGEYAVKAATIGEAREKIELRSEPLICRGELPALFIRPAPPELAEWLEAEMWATNNIGEKVPGGWVADCSKDWQDNGAYCTSAAAVFVPVALAPGITVIGGVE